MTNEEITEAIEDREIQKLNQLILNKEIVLSDEHYELLGEEGLNTCDCCGIIEESECLIWIDSEDFEPLDGEVVPDEAYEKYSALCTKCYNDILVK